MATKRNARVDITRGIMKITRIKKKNTMNNSAHTCDN